MSTIQTLAQRKQARVAEIRAGIAQLREELARYARAEGGQFWIYGSAATGRIRYDSDIDVLVDFDRSRTAAAFDCLEQACARLHLKLDARPKSWCTPAFVERISKLAVVLP